MHTSAEGYEGVFSVEEERHAVGLEGNVQLTVPELAKRYGVYHSLDTPLTFGKGGVESLVVQYEVHLQEGLSCGGAYLKLISQSEVGAFDGTTLDGSTPYSIMFGPDKCGSESKVHFIFRHKNPVTGEWEEKHMTDRPIVQVDEAVHLYTLVLRADDSFSLAVDGIVKRSGSLLSDAEFDPPLQPPQEIDDPEDLKPSEWVDDPEMDDPSAVKPDDWDEDAPALIPDPEDIKPQGWLDNAPDMVPDPEAALPDDWDEDEDGEWEAPMVPNPACETFGCGHWSPRQIPNPDFKGKWSPPQIPNPDYVGEWAPRKIPNPSYFVPETAVRELAPIAGIALELWTMSPAIGFDNILLTSSEAEAQAFQSKSWRPKYDRHVALIQRELEKNKPKFTDQASDALNLLLTIGLANPLLGLAVALGIILLPVLFCCFCCGGASEEEIFVEEYEEEVDAGDVKGGEDDE